MIKVLVVEDSAVVREFLVHILGSDPEIRVVGTASDGKHAVEAVVRTQPDVITMDLHMPEIDGMEATRRIMETHPTPIVIVSGSTDPQEVATTFRAMEAGALAMLRRPAGIGHPDHEATTHELRQTLKLMAEVKVVRRWARVRRDAALTRPAESGLARAPAKVQIVAIGASTGGPPILQGILGSLPATFSAPILIVQHMAAGFTEGFVQWLTQSARLPVRIAVDGEPIHSGHVYVAPDTRQMKVERGGRIALTHDAPENGMRPSVSYLFRSLAEAYGSGIVAGLLTGMGRDGADELKVLRDRGALTFVQDKDSSVVHGMPGAAITLDAAALVLSPEKIVETLRGLAGSAK